MNAIGVIHVVASCLALLSGAWVFVARKGTRLHRLLGRLYVGAMVVLNVTALMIYNLFGGFNAFHVAALFSLATVVPGFMVARNRSAGWLERHYFWMSFSYVGLLSAAASEVATRVPAAPFWWAVMLSSIVVLAVGAWVIFRRAKETLAPFRNGSGSARARP